MTKSVENSTDSEADSKAVRSFATAAPLPHGMNTNWFLAFPGLVASALIFVIGAVVFRLLGVRILKRNANADE
jgi:hypothetical protein